MSAKYPKSYRDNFNGGQFRFKHPKEANLNPKNLRRSPSSLVSDGKNTRATKPRQKCGRGSDLSPLSVLLRVRRCYIFCHRVRDPPATKRKERKTIIVLQHISLLGFLIYFLRAWSSEVFGGIRKCSEIDRHKRSALIGQSLSKTKQSNKS